MVFFAPLVPSIPFHLPLQRQSPGQLYRSIAMQAHDSDSDSSEGGVGGAGQPPANDHVAAVHALNEMRTAALRDIDEGGFSCVASLSLSSV